MPSSSVHAAGHIWAIAHDGSLRFTPAAHIQWRAITTLPSPATTITTCTATATIFVACADLSLHALHPTSAALQASSTNALHSAAQCLCACAAESALFSGLEDGSIVRVHLPSLAFDCMLGLGVEHQQAVRALESDGQYLYSAGDDATVLVWSVPDSKPVRDFNCFSGPIRSLLRVDISLWVGLDNGCVEAFEIFGDAVHGVSQTMKEQPHSRPVNSLVRAGDNTVWSVEDLPHSFDPNRAYAPCVAVWDLRDFSYRLADELDTPFVTSITVVDTLPLQRVTVLALSPDLDAQLIINEGVASSQLATTVPGTVCVAVQPPTNVETAPSQPHYDAMQLYITDLENQLLEANAQIQYLASAVPSHVSPDIDPLISELPDILPPLSPAVRGMDKSLLTELPVHNGSPTQVLGRSPRAMSHEATQHEDALIVEVDDREPDLSQELCLPSSVSGALQRTLTKLADLLVSLLTSEVLAAENKDAPPRNSGKLRESIATLTRELTVGRQLVECCARVDDGDIAELLAQVGPLQSASEATSRSVATDATVKDLRRRLDDAANRMHQYEANLRAVTSERDLVKEDLHQVRAQSELTMKSLEDLLRERATTVESRDKVVLKLRSEVMEMDKALRAEKKRRKILQESVDQGTQQLTEIAHTTAQAYENQLKTSYDKIETKTIEIQALHTAKYTLEGKYEELRTTNCKLEQWGKQARLELSEAMVALESVRKDLSTSLSTKEKQHHDAIHKLKRERDCDVNALNDDMMALRHDAEQHRQKVGQESIKLRSQLRDDEVARRREEMLTELERCRVDLKAARREAEEGQARIAQLESVRENREALVVETKRDADYIGKQLEDKQAEWERVAKENAEKIAKLTIGRESAHRNLNDRENDLKSVELCRDDLEKRLVEKESVIKKLQSEVLQSEAQKKQTSSANVDSASEIKVLLEERDILKLEVEHRIAAAVIYEEESDNMRNVMYELREVANELQASLGHSEQEVHDLQGTIDKLQTTLRMREMRIAQLEIRVSALSGSDAERLDGAEDSDGARPQAVGNARAMRALLVSANGEVEQMGRELEAMYRAESAREKELESLREAVEMRDDKLRKKEATIEDIRVRMRCPKCGYSTAHVEEWSEHTRGEESTTAAVATGDDIGNDNGMSIRHVLRTCLTSSGHSTDGLRQEESLIRATLQELQEGMIITQERLRDVTRLAREYKTLAQSHVDMLPALVELEMYLRRVPTCRVDAHVAKGLSFARGVVQSLVAQYYSAEHKNGCAPVDDQRYAPCAQRLQALQAAVAHMRSVRLAEEGDVGGGPCAATDVATVRGVQGASSAGAGSAGRSDGEVGEVSRGSLEASGVLRREVLERRKTRRLLTF